MHLAHFLSQLAAALPLCTVSLSAQGPISHPVGLRPEQWSLHMDLPAQEAREIISRRSYSKPVLIGAAVGAGSGLIFGLLAIRNPGENGGDGLPPEMVVFSTFLGAGIGALVGHVVNEQK